jgi:hypothetical protein
MENKKKENYNFNEKEEEYDSQQKVNIPVWQSPKYIESKKKVIEMINIGKYDLSESDFWILMNKTSKGDKMAYTGLIISHNGCLKINDSLEEKLKFKPSCVKENKDGFENSLVFTYCSDEQGIYEVGEISDSNYKQQKGRYPYAMAYKRLFDRVVLKNSKLAYAGVYSDSEADEFTEKVEEKSNKDKFLDQTEKEGMMINEGQKQYIKSSLSEKSLKAQLIKLNIEKLEDLTYKQAYQIEQAIKKLQEEKNKNEEEAF